MLKILDFIQKNRFISAISFVVALFSFALPVYSTFFQRDYSISYDIFEKVNVFEVSENAPPIEIIYGGKNLLQSGLNLQIVSIAVRNVGARPIRSGDFDPKLGWGLGIEGGDFVDARLMGVSTEYLKASLDDVIVTKKKIIFPEFVFDSGEEFKYQLRIMQPKLRPASIVPFGKIAGVRSLSVTDTSEDRSRQNIFLRSFNGEPTVQLIRTIGYFFLFILVLVVSVVVGFTISSISAFVGTRIRARKYRDVLRNEGFEELVVEKIVRTLSPMTLTQLQLVGKASESADIRRDLIRALKRRERKRRSNTNGEMDAAETASLQLELSELRADTELAKAKLARSQFNSSSDESLIDIQLSLLGSGFSEVAVMLRREGYLSYASVPDSGLDEKLSAAVRLLLALRT